MILDIIDYNSTLFFVVKALATDTIFEAAPRTLYYVKTILFVCKVISDDTVGFQQLPYYFDEARQSVRIILCICVDSLSLEYSLLFTYRLAFSRDGISLRHLEGPSSPLCQVFWL